MALSKKLFPGYTGKGAAGVDTGWWENQVQRGIDWRNKFLAYDRWGAWDNYYRNQYPVEGARVLSADVMPVNLFYIMARSFVPRVYFRNPSVSVTPSKPGAQQLGLAMLHERIYNKLMKQMRIKQAMRDIVNKGFFRGTAVGKLGFGHQYAPAEYAASSAEGGETKQGSVEYRAGLDPTMPWFLPIETEHYVLPEGTVDRLDAPWECHIIFRDTAELRLDDRFMTTGISGTHAREGLETPDLTEVWEIHDRRTGTTFTMVPHGGDMEAGQVILAPQRDAFQTGNGGPLYTATFNPNMGSVWGLPDGTILEPLQEEITEIASQIMKHRRLSIIKFLGEEGSVSEKQAAAFLEEFDIGAMLLAKERGAIESIQLATIPQELFQSFDQIMEVVRLTFGFSRNQFGEYQSGSEKPTAQEAHAVQQAASIRIDERRDIMADFLVELLEDTGRMIHERWTSERVERVAGPFGVPIWVNYTGEMLKGGKFELNVDPDAGLPQTKELREARAKETFALLYPLSQQPDVQLGHPLINSAKLTRFLLHETQGVAYDDMLYDAPNIYDERLVRALTEGTKGMTEPVNPEQFGQIMQNAGPAGQALRGLGQRGG